jgi:hypothetical protein
MEWFGFWIFAAACVWADAWLYSKGHNGLIFHAKTDKGKAIRHRQAYGGYQPEPRDPRQVMPPPKKP